MADIGPQQAFAIGYNAGVRDFRVWEELNPFLYDFPDPRLAVAWFDGFERAVSDERKREILYSQEKNKNV